jgi:two-component system chemotaxis response regulator CheB
MKPISKIRILIVEDSAFMRIALEKMLREEPDFEIIATAGNGQEALEKVLRLKPDVVTMDIEMPVMDGLAALKEIMRIQPTPVLMVSSLTQNGAQASLDAMDLGAVDYVPKPGSTLSMSVFNLKEDLIRKVRAAAGGMPRIIKHRLADIGQKRPPAGITAQNTRIEKLVMIGASTGGPPAVRSVLSPLPTNLPAPVIVAQHMPPTFTTAFAQRLNSMCNLRVKEAVHGEILQNSVAYVCPGDFQTRFERQPDGKITFLITPNRSEGLRFAPCIDTVFAAASQLVGTGTLGIILTGMGDNGVEGLLKIREAGGFTIAQDKTTSVVFGMPRAAAERNAAARILPLQDMAKEIEIFLR